MLQCNPSLENTHHTRSPHPRLVLLVQIKISGTKTSAAATLLLRGANDMHLDEMDRSLHDALCVVKRVLESGAVVPGAFFLEWVAF